MMRQAFCVTAVWVMLLVVGCSPVTVATPFGERVPPASSGVLGWWTLAITENDEEAFFLEIAPAGDGTYVLTVASDVEADDPLEMELRRVGGRCFMFLGVDEAEGAGSWNVFWWINAPGDADNAPPVMVLAGPKLETWVSAVESGKLAGEVIRKPDARPDSGDNPANAIGNLAFEIRPDTMVHVTATPEEIAAWLATVAVDEAFDVSASGVLFRPGALHIPADVPDALRQ
ncbi:MAG: hypothetical protein AAF656_01715 [Planctomycetota bacterium]